MALLDVAVIGGGPVGAALAAMLARADLALGVFEARPASATDARTLALSHGSREALAEAGGWPGGTTPITEIHVSQRGGPGRTLITAAEQRIPALGYTVSYAALEESLAACLQRGGVPLHHGETCSAIDREADAAVVSFSSGLQVRARLLVLADGGANVSRVPGLAFREKDYGQVAVVAKVWADRPLRGRAYERFTPGGPMALLPVEDHAGLVWTATPEEGARLLALGEDAFLAELQRAFGDRAGRFVSVARRASFPLRLRVINTAVARRTAVIGNAAQVLHPIAGQGLNLGLRDARELATLVAGTPRERLGDPAMLQAYAEGRARDTGRGVAFTDLLVSAFGGTSRVRTLGRGLALAAFDLVPPARRWLAERMIHGAPP